MSFKKNIVEKYTKFRVWIDENHEATCWDLICGEACKDMMEEGVREKVIDYWENHSHAIPDWKHVLRQCSGRGIYKEHCKHVMEMTGVALFEEFKESNPSVNVSFSMFSKLKPWYIRPNTIRDTCCCRYHVEFELYYDTFVDFCKKH